ncbi:2Fe-2S iron-sulfur cluster-binding protein [Sphingomonas sp. XXL09]|uniref:2Fe-2S iron-sulfur cluster-binding protein n=1 Tax=unclassified Sphingomonas TaxID=196159 RepID=UPI0018DF5F2E|nr:2Fe-2S iron-sulfur cluster-binding protein [Sphingomonas sp. MA1305]
MRFTINGQSHQADVDIRTSLLDLCREHLGLTGSKKGCDHGQCGACTMLVNGRRVNSCLSLAVMHQDDEIVTIEGLGTPDQLHPLQSAFVRHDGYQCGYCTPGQICSAAGMLDEVKKGWPSYVSDDLTAPEFGDEEISERMSGNLCRCAAYPNIVDAIREVASSSGDAKTAPTPREPAEAGA